MDGPSWATSSADLARLKPTYRPRGPNIEIGRSLPARSIQLPEVANWNIYRFSVTRYMASVDIHHCAINGTRVRLPPGWQWPSEDKANNPELASSLATKSIPQMGTTNSNFQGKGESLHRCEYQTWMTLVGSKLVDGLLSWVQTASEINLIKDLPVGPSTENENHSPWK